jgi:hypothetical protein
MAYKPPKTPTIATTTMTRTRAADGQVSVITVEIGVPEPLPPEAKRTGWYSTVTITGLPGVSEDDYTVFQGQDSMMALSFAISYPGHLLSAHPIASEIDLHQVPNFGFPKMEGDDEMMKRLKKP